MRTLIFIAVCFLLVQYSTAQQLPVKSEILDKMNLANNYFLAKWPDPTQAIVTDKTRPSNLWTRATYFEGLMQLYYISRDTSIYNYAVNWGTFHKWEPTYGGTTATDADFLCCTQTYIELYQLDTTKTERIAKIKTNADYLINSSKSNYWWWIDAMQMAMPVFSKLGFVLRDNKYYDALYRFYSFPRYYSKGVGLFNTTENFWYRDSSFLPPKTTSNGKSVYWSRGNGWVIVAMARTLDAMNKTAPHYSEYEQMFKNMAPAILAAQRTDGFWNPSLADPNDYGGKETSGTAMFTYAFAWGIRNGLLDSATYYPAMVKAWNAMVIDALHTDGFLGYVQGTGKQPSDAQPVTYTSVPNFEDYGLGAFLLAGSEVYKLAPQSQTTGNTSLKDYTGKLSVYPNPSKGNFTIEMNLTKEASISVHINDPLGRMVSSDISQSTFSKGLQRLTVHVKDKFYDPGLYFLNIRINGKTEVLKIRLEK